MNETQPFLTAVDQALTALNMADISPDGPADSYSRQEVTRAYRSLWDFYDIQRGNNAHLAPRLTEAYKFLKRESVSEWLSDPNKTWEYCPETYAGTDPIWDTPTVKKIPDPPPPPVSEDERPKPPPPPQETSPKPPPQPKPQPPRPTSTYRPSYHTRPTSDQPATIRTRPNPYLKRVVGTASLAIVVGVIVALVAVGHHGGHPLSSSVTTSTPRSTSSTLPAKAAVFVRDGGGHLQLRWNQRRCQCRNDDGNRNGVVGSLHGDGNSRLECPDSRVPIG